MTKAAHLQKGQTIGIFAPAGAIFNHDYFKQIENILSELGLKVKFASNVKKQEGYFAGTDQERIDGFHEMYKDEEVDALLAMRGGWGCQRILDLIDYEYIKQHPKVICGFSDLTSFLNAISLKTGIPTFHGPVGTHQWDDFTRTAFTDCLFTPTQNNLALEADNRQLEILVKGKAHGQLWGGNLTVFTSMVGTKYFPDLKNNILFLEEIGEEPYRIDRMMSQLYTSGSLDGISGLILGQFRKCQPEEPEKAFSLIEVLTYYAQKIGVPCINRASFGHVPHKAVFPIGAEVSMDTSSKQLHITQAYIS